MKSYLHRSYVTTFEFLVLESYGILVSKLDAVQYNAVTDPIGGSRE